jgi:hypothetical protein
MALKTVTREIEESESLIAFAVPTADLPALIEGISTMNGYQPKVENPEYLIHQPVSETNSELIKNPESVELFCMKWLIKQGYQQVISLKRQKAEIERQKALQAEQFAINAKPLMG